MKHVQNILFALCFYSYSWTCDLKAAIIVYFHRRSNTPSNDFCFVLIAYSRADLFWSSLRTYLFTFKPLFDWAQSSCYLYHILSCKWSLIKLSTFLLDDLRRNSYDSFLYFLSKWATCKPNLKRLKYDRSLHKPRICESYFYFAHKQKNWRSFRGGWISCLNFIVLSFSFKRRSLIYLKVAKTLPFSHLIERFVKTYEIF